MIERANPFSDLGDFAPTPAKPKADRAVIDQVAEAHGFPSRQAVKPEVSTAKASTSARTQVAPKEQLPSRRRTTGRSEQVNIKTTFAAKKRLMEISVEQDMPLGEILEQALAALEEKWKATT